MIIKKLLCVICADGKLYGRLHLHVFFKHGIKAQDYTLKYVYGCIQPTCKCGCGKETRYEQFAFAEYCHGHNANRRGAILSEETKEKMSASKKEYLAEHPEVALEKVRLMNETSHTVESNKKRTDSRWSKEENHIKQSISSKKMHENNPQLKEIVGNKVKQWHQSLSSEDRKEIYGDQWKDKISESITNKYLDGGFEWSRGQYFSTKMKESFYYRSSWELTYMKQLDEISDVVSWKYEPFWIPYLKDGEKHRHIPDFLIEFVDGRKEIHEVGVKKLKEEKFAEKIAAIKDFCIKNNYLFKLLEF